MNSAQINFGDPVTVLTSLAFGKMSQQISSEAIIGSKLSLLQCFYMKKIPETFFF